MDFGLGDKLLYKKFIYKIREYRDENPAHIVRIMSILIIILSVIIFFILKGLFSGINLADGAIGAQSCASLIAVILFIGGCILFLKI